MRIFWVVPSLTSLGMVLIGVIGLVSLCALARAGELAPLAVVACFADSEVLWEMVLGIAVSHELPGLASLAGALIVAGTIAFLLVFEHRRVPSGAVSPS